MSGAIQVFLLAVIVAVVADNEGQTSTVTIAQGERRDESTSASREFGMGSRQPATSGLSCPSQPRSGRAHMTPPSRSSAFRSDRFFCYKIG